MGASTTLFFNSAAVHSDSVTRPRRLINAARDAGAPGTPNFAKILTVQKPLGASGLPPGSFWEPLGGYG